MDELFARLVNNALDFLQQAVDDLAESAKYSVVHFNTAVELFLKARLMHEHWSLIVSKKSEPDFDRFLAGDFQSVTLGEAAVRLEKIVRSGLTAQELGKFKEVAKHRNKIMHFFHEAHTPEAGEKRIQAIAKQQLAAWYLLHQLLRVRWKEVFEPWANQIAEIDKALKKRREFLQVVFDHLKDDLKKKKADGVLFSQCPACEFESQQHEDELKQVYVASCLVCDYEQSCLRVLCDECETPVTFHGDGFSTCTACSKEFEPSDLADLVEDEAAAYIAAKDGDDSWVRGNCGDCDGYEMLIRINDEGRYLCVSCLREFEGVHWCQWCNTPNNGDMENSYFAGCNFCEGKAGWESDD